MKTINQDNVWKISKYLENKFNYVKSEGGGYINQSAFILKYQDLFIVKMED